MQSGPNGLFVLESVKAIPNHEHEKKVRKSVRRRGRSNNETEEQRNARKQKNRDQKRRERASRAYDPELRKKRDEQLPYTNAGDGKQLEDIKSTAVDIETSDKPVNQVDDSQTNDPTNGHPDMEYVDEELKGSENMLEEYNDLEPWTSQPPADTDADPEPSVFADSNNGNYGRTTDLSE